MILCFIFLLAARSVSGQKQAWVTGKVTDASGGEPLIAVNISANRRSGTISDQEGSYSLNLEPGKHLIEFFYIGYARESIEVELEAGETIRLDVEMEISRKMLDEVVVSAGKYEQRLSDVTVSMEVIKPRQLSNQNIPSLDMILEKTPGISILDGQPSIRGGSGFSYGVGSRVLMLVDDLPMISADAGDIKWNYLPVENLNQVEVIKGASSVLYGSSALNGVINFRTRFPGQEPQTEVTLFGGMYTDPRRGELVWWDRQPLQAGASLSHLRKIGNLDLTLGGNYYRDEGYREYDYEHRIRGNLALRYNSRKHRGLVFGITSSAMYIDQADFLLWVDADSGAYRQNPDTRTPLTGHRYNIDPFVEYLTPAGNKHSLKTRLYSVGNATLNIDRSSYAKLWYAEYRFQKRFWSRSNWTSGISFSRNTVLANLYENHAGTTTALYTQVDAHLIERLKLSTGLRWEFNTLNGDLYYSLPVFRAGINYQAAEATFLRASYGQGYRFPSVAEKYADADIGGLKIFKNPGLEPERGWAAEIGVKQGFTLGAWMGFADLAIYRTDYRNMIEYTFGAYPPDSIEIPTIEHVGFKALNIGTARITGAEAVITGSGGVGPFELILTGGYTFMHPVDPEILSDSAITGEESHILKYRRRHQAKGDMEWVYRDFFTGIGVQYNSRMINVDQVFIDPLIGNLLQPGFPDYWQTHATGYTLVDFRLGWNISQHLRVVANMRNAFNIEYLGRPGDIGPPRNISFQLKLNF